MAELCSLITMSAIGNSDRVGLILFSDRIELLIPPGKGRQHALRIMEALVRHEPEGRADAFADVLGRFGHMARKQSVAFVVSDFLAADYLEEMRSLAVRHDMNAVNLLEPHGRRAGGARDWCGCEDAESGERALPGPGLPGRRTRSGTTSVLQEQMLESGVQPDGSGGRGGLCVGTGGVFPVAPAPGGG